MSYKQFILFFVLICFQILGFSQEYSFEDLKGYSLIENGSITSKNEVQGYYLFFKKDQKKKDSTEFIIKILDQNLNELTNRIYVTDPLTTIEALVFNGKSILVKEFKVDGTKLHFNVYDMNVKGDMKLMGEQDIKEDKDSRSLVYGIPDKGFVNIYGTKQREAILEYYNDGELKWTYNTPDNINWEELDLITTYEDKLIMSSFRASQVTNGGDYYLKAFDINSGEELYEKVMTFYGYDHEIARGFANPLQEEIWISGDYFDKGDEEKIENSNGLFVMKISPDGEILDSDYVPWDGKIERYSKTYKKGKLKNGFIYIHDFVFLNDGQVFGIGEQYRKAFRPWGVAETVLTLGSMGRLIKVDIGDLLIFRFGNNAKLSETKRNRKPANTVLPNKGIWGGVLIPGKKIGQVMDDQNAYDFSHISVDNNNEHFTVFYSMKESLNKKQMKQYKRQPRWILRTITYQDREWIKDKLYLTDGKSEGNIALLPAKPGYVLINESSSDFNGLKLIKLKQ